MKSKICQTTLLLGAFAIAAACSKADEGPASTSERNFQYAEDGNGELNVLGCKVMTEQAVSEMAYMPHVQTWSFGDLSKLEKPGDRVDDLVTLHQVQRLEQPEQLGLVMLDGWSATFELDDAGTEVIRVSGQGEKTSEQPKMVEYVVPFWEGLYETKFVTRDVQGNVTEEWDMLCEVSFWRR
ncbi:hypothetical protein L6R52_11085 [Myxococcota bacterium]|nr:hypothetical protein [Myxococcota bacterium]